MALWVLVNTILLLVPHFDPYPFIFLNLAMSAEAAFATPIILMSGKVQEAYNQRQQQHLDQVLAGITQLQMTTDQHIQDSAADQKCILTEIAALVRIAVPPTSESDV